MARNMQRNMKIYNKQVHQVGNKKSNITKMHGQQHIKIRFFLCSYSQTVFFFCSDLDQCKTFVFVIPEQVKLNRNRLVSLRQKIVPRYPSFCEGHNRAAVVPKDLLYRISRNMDIHLLHCRDILARRRFCRQRLSRVLYKFDRRFSRLYQLPHRQECGPMDGHKVFLLLSCKMCVNIKILAL